MALQSVRSIAAELRRTPNEIHCMAYRLGLSCGKQKGFTVHSLATALKRNWRVIRGWIESGALEATNEGSEEMPRRVISRESLARFHEQQAELIKKSRVDRNRIKAILDGTLRSHNR